MTGEEFRKLTPAQLDEKLPLLQVLARSSPEDKHMLVQRLNGGLMPETREQWDEAHPNKDYDTQRDLLLPGYKEEWANRSSQSLIRHQAFRARALLFGGVDRR